MRTTIDPAPKQQRYSSRQLSELEESVLTVLSTNELYGLQIIEAFESASEGKRKLSIGTLYPLLHRLENRGLIASRMEEPNEFSKTKGGARRKYFKNTRKGIRILVEDQKQREEFLDRLHNWQPATS